MKNKLLIILSFALISNWGNAQQLEGTNLYEFNKLKLNPAFAGERACGELQVGHLGQFAGFDGAPQVSYVNGSAEIGKNMSLGGKATLDRLGSLTRFNVQGIYAYKLNFGEGHNLRLGIGAGINQHAFDFSGSTIQVQSDASLVDGRTKGISFYSEAGLVYTLKNFQLSFSVPNLVETNTSLSSTISGELANRRHMVGYAGYRFGKPDKVTVTPSVLFKNGAGGQNQFEGNVMLNLKQVFQLGVGYRHNAGLLGRLGFNINDQVQIAYAYEFPMTDLSKVSSGSHEVLIGFNMCGKPRSMPVIPQPRIDTVYVESTLIEADTVIVEKVVEVEKDDKPELEHSIYYESAEAKLDIEKEKEGLSKIVDYLIENKEAIIYIKGYASEDGEEYSNFQLSADRVKNVYTYLLSQNVKRSQMISIIQGEATELHGVDHKETKEENRRVTIVLK
ncbi:MAG: PorP/SprF family type IX secretion system membrane protein [Crocinitomicaceae bacterium]|nr:PorP/SprF family type IX secretion system membrane protein [Crocinitomicaceae bacterium]